MQQAGTSGEQGALGRPHLTTARVHSAAHKRPTAIDAKYLLRSGPSPLGKPTCSRRLSAYMYKYCQTLDTTQPCTGVQYVLVLTTGRQLRPWSARLVEQSAFRPMPSLEMCAAEGSESLTGMSGNVTWTQVVGDHCWLAWPVLYVLCTGV